MVFLESRPYCRRNVQKQRVLSYRRPSAAESGALCGLMWGGVAVEIISFTNCFGGAGFANPPVQKNKGAWRVQPHHAIGYCAFSPTVRD